MWASYAINNRARCIWCTSPTHKIDAPLVSEDVRIYMRSYFQCPLLLVKIDDHKLLGCLLDDLHSHSGPFNNLLPGNLLHQCTHIWTI